jgi:hypothetical protein
MDFLNAATFVRKQRSIIFPNFGFQRQLLHLEQMIKNNKAKNDNISIYSKSKKSVRSAKPDNRSEPRSNYQSTASVYRGKHRNKFRKSVKVSKGGKLSKEKAFHSYKEKAKKYYLGMQNNWVGSSTTTNNPIKHNYRSTDTERKCKTANLQYSMTRKSMQKLQMDRYEKTNQETTLHNSPNYKRLNKEHQKTSLIEKVEFSPKSKIDPIYAQVRSYYQGGHLDQRKYSKSTIRNNQKNHQEGVGAHKIAKLGNQGREVKFTGNYRSIIY